MSVRFSARNQLRAKVKSVKLGNVMAEVISAFISSRVLLDIVKDL